MLFEISLECFATFALCGWCHGARGEWKYRGYTQDSGAEGSINGWKSLREQYCTLSCNNSALQNFLPHPLRRPTFKAIPL